MGLLQPKSEQFPSCGKTGTQTWYDIIKEGPETTEEVSAARWKEHQDGSNRVIHEPPLVSEAQCHGSVPGIAARDGLGLVVATWKSPTHSSKMVEMFSMFHKHHADI